MASSNSPCAACKFLRRKCTQGCVFAPYFPPDQPSKFSNVHRVFGASNVAKLLNDLNPAQREDAVNSLAYEADARLRDPVYGCVGHISVLQQKLKQVQSDLVAAKQELSTYIGPAAYSSFIPHNVYPHHLAGGQGHHLHLQAAAAGGGMPPFGVPAAGMGLGLIQPGAAASQQHHQQMMMREQQQHQQMVEQQQQIAAVAAAREQQEYLRMEQQQQHQQQQEQFVRLGTGSDGGGGGFGGFNQAGGGGGAAAAVSLATGPPSGLALVPVAAAQQFDNLFHVQQQFQDHHQQQNHHHHHQRARSDEGRRNGIGPSS